ncbi:hypothetical protein CHLRE_02g144009v5 [Chlamydomonas reinhardtii]|uniref:SGNH hydrolase-type esterase domain-containing protein n=1 Tax=Chlamydomonas reinhardtii TaxID=3055 RepID=A0A2K3E3Y8_CHLRE|nr:uncharacterized protein CHLRE_02g144009v5 [Chlamydomonas reinhardtii]PNW87491.1 hypothetical protein CHLRE_02g144009v5 [Chlamydomonas reinhardtii]
MSPARRQCAAPLAAALLLLLAAGCALASASRTDDGFSGNYNKKGGKNPGSRRASPPPARRRYPPPVGSGGLTTSRPSPAAAPGGGDTRERIDLVVFGDSLSDTGNTFRAAGVPQADLYYQGRYSNGPVWIDYLAAEVANNNSATTVLNVINLAYGGATACPAYSVAAQYPFVLDLPQQTAAFLAQPPSASAATAALRHAQGQAQAQAAAQAAALALAALQAVVQAALGVGSGAGGGSSSPNGGGGGRRLLPINFIGINDVRFFANEAVRTGAFANASVIASAVAAITSCRLTWAQQLLAAGEAVWGQQRGPQRVLVLLPVARLDLSPSVPEPFKSAVAAFTAALNSALTLAAAALEVQLQQPAAATGGADSVGARLLVLPDASEELLASVNPPFNNTYAQSR